MPLPNFCFVRSLVKALPLLLVYGCKDVSSFNSGGGAYAGEVVPAGFILTGIDAGTHLCLTLDTSRIERSPGTLSTDDGRFRASPMRSIPQLWEDPLSTFGFGDGRIRNMIYVVTPTPNDDGGTELGDVTAVVSLMQSGGVEARLLRGAPPVAGDDAGLSSASLSGPNIFAVFALSHQDTPCSY